ncbi:unnamed protein product [Leptosia nina]|uniref:Reverse transcriptase n=1 Tax=Leptosia nina TaxID=320188 RepID=A0AAV1JEE9_9NEOP
MAHISNVAMPRVRAPPNKDQVYWWSPELARLRAACSAARRHYSRYRRRHRGNGDPAEENRIYAVYIEAKNIMRQKIAEAKQRAWEEFLESLELDPWGRPYKLVMNRLRPWAPPLTAAMEPSLLTSIVSALFPPHASGLGSRVGVREVTEDSESVRR